MAGRRPDGPVHNKMIIIRGARLPDPTGGLTAAVDIHITDASVTAVVPAAAKPLRGAQVINADGRIAMPGFIDTHVHGEAAVFDPEVQLAMLRQGVTSIIIGQDGVSYAPSSSDHEAPGDHDAHAWASGYFAAINGDHPTFRGGSVAELLRTYEGTTPINVAYLAPHGTIRYAVMGDAARRATPAEIDAMSALLTEALDDGACGLSTGLEYVPGAHAGTSELTSLTKILAERELPHVSHMRGYEEKAGPAVRELVSIALASGVSTHISHFHGPSTELLSFLRMAQDQGVPLTFDSYPYLRGCSILSMIALPTWLPIAEPEATLRALRDPTVLALLRAEHFESLADVWERITLAAVPGDMQWAEGMTLDAVAEQLNLEPEDAAIELLISTRLRATAVFAQPPSNSAASVRTLLRHRSHMGGSDAIYGGGRPHPRGWGAFARFLAIHVVKFGDWTWAEAEHHLSRAAARKFGFIGRGVLRPGAVADIILVDPDQIEDRATYSAPRELATGVSDVLVAGVPVLARGQLTGQTPGAALRPRVRTSAFTKE